MSVFVRCLKFDVELGSECYLKAYVTNNLNIIEKKSIEVHYFFLGAHKINNGIS